MWSMKYLTVFRANEIPMSQSTSKQNSKWHAFIQSRVCRPRKVPMGLFAKILDLSLAGCNLCEASFPRDFSNLLMLQDLNLSKNPISCLPDCIRTLSRLNKLELVGCRARTFHLNGCKELTDMEGSFKLEVMGGIEKTMKSLELSMLDSAGSFEVKLYNNSTDTESRGPVKVVFEKGMISIFLPGSKVPNWFCYKSAGATLSFTVPSPPDLKIQGITVCSVYTIDWKPKNEMLWFSHWKFQSQLDAGDNLNVAVLTMDGFSIKEIGIHLMHGQRFLLRINSSSIQRLPRSFGIISSVNSQSARSKICNDRGNKASEKLIDFELSLGFGKNEQKTDTNMLATPVDKGASFFCSPICIELLQRLHISPRCPCFLNNISGLQKNIKVIREESDGFSNAECPNKRKSKKNGVVICIVMPHPRKLRTR
ncbi:hypothetical protein K7X08_009208 [Anisodus acutangulus]|uniref:Uncharacterized protein n=1 Tax=Anisodus acutangulus TaxID=402998 RepID=A0A9Q1MYV6_9SOLA|nr:hypothetical protein K7X08_009208 [Anisodus acutangulus]